MITKNKKFYSWLSLDNTKKYVNYYLLAASIVFLVMGFILVFKAGNTRAIIQLNKLIDHDIVVLRTSVGDVTILLDNRSSIAANNFLRLAQSGFYDGTKFHRVIKGLMIQGGDPYSKNDLLKALWGHGGPGYTFADEFHKDDKMVRGVVAMANNGPNTNGSQFFILTTKEASIYLKRNTIFGHVINGMNVVDRIGDVSVNILDIPLSDITINKVDIISP